MSKTNNKNQFGALPAKGALWIVLFTWIIWSARANDVNCCPDGEMWSSSFFNCSDGSKVHLRCSTGGYLLDPDSLPFDNFTIVQAHGETRLELTNYEKIMSSRFCVARRPNATQIAMVCYEEDSSMIWKTTLYCILSIISVVFLIATLAVYVLLPELRDIQDKAMMAVVTSLAVSYIILSIQNLKPPHKGDDFTICLALGFILYYGFMSVFFWLNIVSFNIWRTVWFRNFTISDKPLFLTYCIVGWGAPTCFLVLVLVTHHVEGSHMKPGFGEVSCWFSGPEQTWAYFYGPVGALLTLNTIYLGLTSWRLWHQYRDCSGSKLRALRFKCLLYVKLIFVMGITWIFEVLSFADLTKNDFWIPTDILNSLQGFIIFLLLVATRKRVRKLLAKKKPCGISFPKSWTAYDDEECEEVLPEELELSQQDVA